MSMVKGAGDTDSGSNPAVQSKFDRSHGRGLKAPHLSYPGQVAPVTTSAPTTRQEPKEVGFKSMQKQGSASKVAK